uniref:Uncharacterized protein n=1 Tax=Timema poppense TaxID=170557 RepID=A0A7R9H279_TIMPO|nr:unnamed protein product [Timema poppensis]
MTRPMAGTGPNQNQSSISPSSAVKSTVRISP